jgi:hypothetical protein
LSAGWACFTLDALWTLFASCSASAGNADGTGRTGLAIDSRRTGSPTRAGSARVAR